MVRSKMASDALISENSFDGNGMSKIQLTWLNIYNIQ